MDTGIDITAAPAGQQTPSIYSLLAAYWARYETFDRAFKLTDDTPAGPDHDAAEAAQNAACDLVDEAVIAICEYVPTWSVDASIKANFIEGLVERNGGHLDEVATNALIATLPSVWAPRPSCGDRNEDLRP